MAGKPRPLIVEKKDFKIFLAAQLASFGGVQGLADHLGVTGSRVYAMLSGNEGPTEEIVERIGLRAAYVMDVHVPEDEPPAKPAKGKR